MKLKLILKLQGFNSVPFDLLVCPELDRVFGKSWNSRTFTVSSFSSGEKLHVQRFGRYTTLEPIHRVDRWLFIFCSDDNGTVSGIFDLKNLEFLDLTDLRGTDVAQSRFGNGAATNSHAFLRSPIMEPTHSYAFDLAEGVFFRNADGVVKFPTFAVLGHGFWATYEGGIEDGWLRVRRMNSSGFPSDGDGILFDDSAAPRIAAVWDDRLLFCDDATYGVDLRCVTMKGVLVYAIPITKERLGEGMSYQAYFCIFVNGIGEERVLTAVGDGYLEIAGTDKFTKLTYYRLLVFDSATGSKIWEKKIEASSAIKPFVAGQHVIVPWADGFDAIDLDTGESQRLPWPVAGELPRVRCFPGNNETFASRAVVNRSGPEANPPLPYFLWQEGDGKPMFIGRIEES